MKGIIPIGFFLFLFLGCIQDQPQPEKPETIGLPAEKDLKEVRTWFYYLNVDLDAVLEDIVESDYDMVVIDPVFTENDNRDYGIKTALARIKNSSGANLENKIVLAYIDIGEAESYRYYWKPEWEIGNPEFIAGADPDLWEDNYPVAFWKEEWQDIWFKGDDAQLKAIIDAGFDGVYLDWVEAYSDENVLLVAKKDGKDPVTEMKKFVGKIKDYGKTRNPDFIVIAQNAAELAEHGDYVSSIDAIAQEQVWFDGSALGLPEGDCPLPEKEGDVDTPKYENTLSPGCLKMYRELPESTLHVSSAEYIGYLKTAKSKGLPVFTVDYALEEENIVLAYNRSRSLGFVPFVSNRPLNQFVKPR